MSVNKEEINPVSETKQTGGAPAGGSKAHAQPKTKGKAVLSGPLHGFTPYRPKRGEEYMNEAQVEHFSNILRSWKTELMEEVDRTVHHMQDEAANFPDPNDRATQESEFSLELRTRDRERKLIRKIDESLASLEAGDYGYCESCGVEIGIRRLEARPTATQCIDCKTLDEIREKQMTG
jgi:DnaK suppressor protein